MKSCYELSEMVEAIEEIVKRSGAEGVRPMDVKAAIDKRWVGWQTPCLRTIERHLNKNPNIKHKPNVGAKRRGRVYAPWSYGYYVSAEPGQYSAGRGRAGSVAGRGRRVEVDSWIPVVRSQLER